MAILVGTDEAGYGPNFGPLVISATRWRIPDRLLGQDLYDLLSGCIHRDPDDDRIAVADSKALYKPGKGLARLERGVLSSARTVGLPVRDWRQAWRSLAPSSVADLKILPWYKTFERELPIDAEPQAIQQGGELLAACFQDTDIALQQIEAVAVFPDRFNQLVEDLAKRLIADCDERQILVQCDKHGGRNRYGPMLQQRFPDYLVEVVRESRGVSIYRWGPQEQRVEFRFVAKGESFLPAALASMMSKYLRELAMKAFNTFWQNHLPEIRPTAGYPVDANRFRRQIRPVQNRLGIADQVLWRNR